MYFYLLKVSAPNCSFIVINIIIIIIIVIIIIMIIIISIVECLRL